MGRAARFGTFAVMAGAPTSRSLPDGASVVVVGGGIAGLEALLALHHLAGERAALTLVSTSPEFVYRPWLVSEPFGPEPAERRDLAPIAELVGAGFEVAALRAIRPDDGAAELADDRELSYDALVVCVGARLRSAFRGVRTLALGHESVQINELLEAAAASASRRLALIVPPGATWALPLYEVALMAERRARELDLSVEIEVVTPEGRPLIVFGRMPSDAVAALLAARGITVRTSCWAVQHDDEIELRPSGDLLEAGAMLALPILDGPAISGLPADDRGFIPIDEHARVRGLEDVYAAGDGTNFPIKQGGLGTQQADAAAEHIAARLGALDQPRAFHPVLRGSLLTGEDSLNLSADVAGGSGTGVASSDYLWWPPQKVGGRYLAPFLSGSDAELEPEPPRRATDVEVAFPHEWHREPMALDPYGPVHDD